MFQSNKNWATNNERNSNLTSKIDVPINRLFCSQQRRCTFVQFFFFFLSHTSSFDVRLCICVWVIFSASSFVQSFHAFQSKFYGVRTEKCHRTYNFYIQNVKLHLARHQIVKNCSFYEILKLYLSVKKNRVKMDDITVEVCGENGAWYKVCRK